MSNHSTSSAEKSFTASADEECNVEAPENSGDWFAGVLLLRRFPFENGDFVECVGIDEAVDAITSAVQDCGSVATSKPVQVFPEGFGSSSMDIQVAWGTDARPVDVRASRGEEVSRRTAPEFRLTV